MTHKHNEKQTQILQSYLLMGIGK